MALATRGRRLLQVGLVTIATGAIYGAMTHSRAIKTAHRERQTVKQIQIEKRSEMLCRRLEGSDGPRQQFTDVRYVVRPDGRRHKLWVVDSTDMRAQHRVRMIWDMETGRLISAAHLPERDNALHLPELSPARAAEVAWHWLDNMDISSTNQRWRVAQPPQLNPLSWIVVLRSSDSTATVIFDRHTQDLVYLMVKLGDPHRLTL